VNPKSTGILFLVAAALGAFVWFYEIGGEEERRAAEEAQQRVVVGIAADDVEMIALTTADGTAVAVERGESGWRLTQPLAYPADPFVLDAMAAAIAEMGGGAALDEPQALAVYGLDAPEREVRFSAGGEERALRIGDKTPLGANSYVTVVGSDAVVTVPSVGVTAFEKTLDDIREKKLLDFDQDAVRHIAVNWPDGGVVLQRSESGGRRWHVVQPVAGPADDETIARLLSTLAFLRADGFVDEPPSDEAAGLERPAFSVRLTGGAAADDGADEPSPFEATLAIGSLAVDGARLVRGAQPGLYRLNEDRIEELHTTVVAYRDKELARFAPLDAQRVEIGFSAEGNSVALTATRGDAGWSSEPESFGAGKIEAMITALADLRAVDIAADAMGEGELAGVGLAPANATFEVYGAAPEEGGDAPVLAVVRLGATRGSDGVLARRAKDDTVFVLGLEESEFLPISHEAFGNHFRSQEVEPEAEAVAPTADTPDAP
jgi:hypothetical protein